MVTESKTMNCLGIGCGRMWRGQGWGESGRLQVGMRKLQSLIVTMVSQLCTYVKTYQMLSFK